MVLEMSDKITGNENIFKELGSLQEKVLFFLADNPNNHKQAIQQGIDHPAAQYGSVLKAVDALEKLGYIESKTVTSKKNVQIKTYICTELCVFYALTRNSKLNIPEMLDAYKDKIDFCKQFRALYNAWGHDHFMLFLADMREFLPTIQENGMEQAMAYLIMKMAKQAKSVDQKTRTKNVREAMKQFPKTRPMLKEWRNNIDEVLK